MISKETIHKEMSEHLTAAVNKEGVHFGDGYNSGYAEALGFVLDHWDEIYQAHRMESATEDAKEYLRDYIVNEHEYSLIVLSNLPEKIARTFLDNYDPNVAASDQYDRAISQYDSMIEELLRN